MEKDLKELKAEFEEGKIQAYPNFESEEPLYSPRIGLHWILLEYSLRNKMECSERFIGCWGRKCNRYEKNYPSYKGEFLALASKVYDKWEHILKYQPPF